MKILQVTAVDFTVKKFLLPLVDDLSNNGYEVHIACNIDNIGKKLDEKGYMMKHIPFTRNTNVFKHIIALIKLVKLIREEKYDIIHSHTPVASLIARLAAFITKVPLNVYTAHGFYFHENMKPILYKVAYSIEKIWAKYFTDVIFFQSIEDYQLAVQNKFNKKENLIHISNGVSREVFNPKKYNRELIRHNLQLEGMTSLLFVGRLVKEKGIIELLNAFEVLAIKHPNLVLLLVGGEVSGDRDGISPKEVIEKMPNTIKKRIHLLGLRDDIPELLIASDIFTLPSYREGLPRSIIEAMAMEKPIVATNIRGCREEVQEGVNGYLCNDRDVDSLVDSLDKIVSDSVKIKEFGLKSRKIFLENFDEQRVLDKQIQVFNEFEVNYINRN